MRSEKQENRISAKEKDPNLTTVQLENSNHGNAGAPSNAMQLCIGW